MILDVVVPYRVDSSFHYGIPQGLEKTPTVGSVVEVKFKNRQTHAFVIDTLTSTPVPPEKLLNITEVMVSEPIFDPEMLKFLKWISDYYCHPLGEVLATALPKACWLPKKRKTKKEKIQKEVLPAQGPFLNEDQARVLETILKPNELKPYLLHGVTGSGKTEVYIRVLESILSEGKGGIILVPEIALTPLLLGRFSERFPGKVAILHSDLSQKECYSEWERIRKGEAKIVVGARSAVFAPVPNLGVIVVDEEHEPSFKQEDSVRYHARDLAIVRAHFAKAKIILGSATPSLESYANAQNGKYLYCELKNRISSCGMPKIHFVDMKDSSELYNPKLPWLSKTLVSKIHNVLSLKQQVLLYLNRLGFAHFLFCRDCGHTWRCRACDVALTYYKNPPTLKCHYCGVIRKPPSQCEECQGTKLESIGIGTEQVENELKGIFPTARIGRMDRSQIKNREDLETIIRRIAEKEIDIVIGTQMIAKGHDFPGIALVGILMADASLNIPDFRAEERTFQIMTQVSGRAGRADIAGEVVLQTLQPEHPVFHFAAQNNSIDFYRNQLVTRKAFSFPPYQKLASLKFQHKNPIQVANFSNEVCAFLKKEAFKNNSIVLGPSEAPIAKMKHLYRWHCLVKAPSVKEMQELLRKVNQYIDFRKSSVQFAVDIDPMSVV